jgi:hypothetical protein
MPKKNKKDKNYYIHILLCKQQQVTVQLMYIGFRRHCSLLVNNI